MSRRWKIILVLVAVISFGIALSYPILYKRAENQNEKGLEMLADMRAQALREAETSGASSAEETDQTPGGSVPSGTEADLSAPNPDSRPAGIRDTESAGFLPEGEQTDEAPREDGPGEAGELGETDGAVSEAEVPGGEEAAGQPDEEGTFSEAETPLPQDEAEEPVIEDYLLDYVPGLTWRQTVIPEYEEYDAPVLLHTPKAAENRDVRQEPLPYPLKEKITLNPDRILPELKEIYELNHDLAGWIQIPGTEVDFPVVQTEDSEFYLKHDFFGEENSNGQIILDTKCDPYTPSYNLVISGHHMRSGAMFGNLPAYKDKSYWEEHKLVEFDNLMAHGKYVVFASFYSADYDEYEEGFRYNANLQYKIDAQLWLAEVAENALYETGIPVEFGDEFITLTTCERSRRQNGRFVVVCRKIREGEEIA